MVTSRSDASRHSIALAYSLAYAFVFILGVVHRWPLLDPPSLWLDDQWVATLVRFAGLEELFGYRASAPMGFVAFSKIAPIWVSDVEIGLQLFPMACGLAMPIALGLFVARMTGHASLGLLAAAIATANPITAGYSMRVKQFSFDALISTGMLAVGLPLLMGRARLPWWPVLTSIAAGWLTYVSALISLPLLHVAALRVWLRDAAARTRALVSIAVLDLSFFLLYWLRVRHQSRTGTVEFWMERGGLPHDKSFGALLDYYLLDGIFLRGIAGALPVLPKIVAAAIAGLALLWLLREARTRFIGLFFLGFYAQLAVAAGLRLYPFGGDRTDIFSYPVTISLVMLVAGHALNTLRTSNPMRLRNTTRGIAALALALPIAAFAFARFDPVGQVITDDAEMVRILEAERREGDVVVVSYQSRYAVATYGSWPMTYVQPEVGKFYVRVDRPDTHVMRDHDAFEGSWIENAQRVLYLHVNLTERNAPYREEIEGRIDSSGFERVDRIERRRGSLSIFEAES